MINDPSKDLTASTDPVWVHSLAERSSLQEDADLLAIYVETGQRQAMDALIRRHGPMVAGVARRILADANDVEDVFQATFLILLRSVHKIRKTQSIASWLYGVAYRTAVRLRQRGRRKPTIPIQDAPFVFESDPCPLARLAREMELESLDEELQKLPDRIRMPIIEHYLLGFTAPQIAERMELHLTAIEGRLRRGRKLLRQSLARRGISLSVVLVGAEWFQRQVEAKELSQFAQSMEGLFQSHSETTHSSSDQNLFIQRLIQEEMNMNMTSLWKIAGIGGGSLAVAGLFGLSAIALPIGNGHNDGVTIDAKNQVGASTEMQEAVQLNWDGENRVLAQSGAGLAPSHTGAQPPQTPNTSSNLDEAASIEVVFEKPATPAPAFMQNGIQEAEMESTIRNKLLAGKKIALDLNNVPLKEAFHHVSDLIGVPVLLNGKALEDAGVSSDTPVEMSLPSLTPRTALERLLDQHDLCYRIFPEYILVTTRDDPEVSFIRYYDMAHFIASSRTIPDVVKAICSSIENVNWDVNGGSDTISTVGSIMVVRTSEKAHRQIERFLAEISKMSPNNQKAKGQSSVQAPGWMGGMGGMGGWRDGGMGGMGGGMF